MNKSVLIIVAGIMLLVGGAAACVSRGTTPTPAPPTFTPEDILETYRTNPANGKDSFEGKTARVEATVRSFNENDLHVAYLTNKPRFLWGSGNFEVFYIHASEKHIATLQIGQEYVWDCIVSTQKLNWWRGKELKCMAVAIVSRG